MFKRKIFLSGAFLMIILLAASIVFGTALAQEQVVLKFVGWIGAEEAGIPAKEALIEGFENKYPNIKIEAVDVPFREVPRRLTTMAVAGNAPDVAQIFSFSLASNAAQGSLEPLDNYFTEEEFSNLVATHTFNDEIVAVTWNPGISAMFYSKKLFKEAGIENIPNNFDEFREAVNKISNLGEEIYGFVQHMDFSPSSMYWHGPWLWTRGGGIWNQDGEVIINNEGSTEYVKMLQEWSNNKWIPLGLTGSEPRLLLANHRTGFMVDGPWTKGILLSASGDNNFEGNWGVFPLHQVMPEEPVVSSSDHTLGVFKQSEHKEEAVKFVKYLLSDEAAKIRFEEQGMLPPKKAHFDLEAFNTPYLQAFAKSIPYIYNEKWTPNNEVISDKIVEGYQRVLYNDEPIEETLNKTAEQVELLTPADWFE